MVHQLRMVFEIRSCGFKTCPDELDQSSSIIMKVPLPNPGFKKNKNYGLGSLGVGFRILSPEHIFFLQKQGKICHLILID